MCSYTIPAWLLRLFGSKDPVLDIGLGSGIFGFNLDLVRRYSDTSPFCVIEVIPSLTLESSQLEVYGFDLQPHFLSLRVQL